MPPRKRNSIEVGALHIHTDIMVRGKSIVRAKVLWIKNFLLTILYAYPDMSAITNGLFYINEKTNNRTSCFCIRLKDVQTKFAINSILSITPQKKDYLASQNNRFRRGIDDHHTVHPFWQEPTR